MKGVILQPNYIPWYGYFELIKEADIFVFLDDVQYTRRDWRNRNKILTKDGDVQWLTVPVIKESRDTLLIKETKIDNSQDWAKKHFSTLKQNYSNTPYWHDYSDLLKHLYSLNYETIDDLDISFIKSIAKILNLDTKFVKSSSYDSVGSKDNKLVDLCKKIGISTYISGPSAMNYIDERNFDHNNIHLRYFEYKMLTYKQVHSKIFFPNVTVLDLLFNCGDKSCKYI